VPFVRPTHMDAEAFAELVDAHADGMYRFAHSLLKEEDVAEDAVQDAFEGLWRKRKTVTPGKYKSYLFTSVHNRCMDALRRRRPTVEPEVALAKLGTDTPPPHDLQTHLHEALSTLNERQQSLVLLRDYEGYSYAEIAEITAMSLDAVKVNLFRARRALRDQLGTLTHWV